MAAAVERLWSGSDGKYQVQASYVCLFQDKKVKLRKPNGALIAIPLNLLCPEDIAFIATQSKPLKRDTTIKESNIENQLGTKDLSKTSSLYSAKTLTTTPENHKTEYDIVSSALKAETIPQEVVKSAKNQNVRHMSEDESTQMIPKRSLSSITNQFKRQTFLSDDKHSDIKNLANIPSKALTLIASYLDFRSRLRLSSSNRRLHLIIYKPEVWTTLTYHPSDLAMIDDEYYYQTVVYLQQRGNLQKAIKHVNLDGTQVTSASVLLSIKYLENLDTLSIQSCWNLMTFKLANDLTNLAMKIPNPYPSKISKVIIGKVLHRGATEAVKNTEQSKPLESLSFGQDVWFINSALNKLSGKNVSFDVVLCASCHIGAASQDFMCVSCGILPLQKCVVCAPRCDRCGNRSCGLPTCNDHRKKVQVAKCGRCESTLALCNNEKSIVCQAGRKPCESCHRLYHVRCRTADGKFVSNQCSGCGTVACPHCELSGCSGGCHGQWCRKCVSKVDLSYCKCIVIKGAGHAASKSISKRNVCGKCQKSCKKCKTNRFCDRCLHVHSAKCA